MTTEIPQAILTRIAKLLALADNKRNSSEAEALAAAMKAQALMQEYNLSLAEVEAAGGKADDGGREKRATGRRAMYGWQVNLMMTLAEANFCLHRVHVVYGEDEAGQQRRSRQHQLVGRKVNVETVQLVYDYLVQTMKRLVTEAGHAPGNHSERDYHAWLDGCSERLRERIKEQAAEAMKASEAAKKAAGNGDGRALVLSDVYGTEADLNNDAMYGYAPGTTATKRREHEARVARQEARYEELKKQGVEDTEAWYLSHGYGAEDAKAAATKWNRSQHRSRSGRGYRGGG